MKCPRCGFENRKKTDNFCSQCGKSFIDANAIKKILKISFTIILLIFLIIMGLYIYKMQRSKRQIMRAEKIVGNYLYDKYGKQTITDIKYYSRGYKRIDIFNYDKSIRQFVFKYYAVNYSDREFYVTLWENNETGEIDIEEVNGEASAIDDNCSVNYGDGDGLSDLEGSRS